MDVLQRQLPFGFDCLILRCHAIQLHEVLSEEQYEFGCGPIDLVHLDFHPFPHSDFFFLIHIGIEFGLLMELVAPCFKL